MPFPTLAEIDGVRVFTNGSGELFVENVESGVYLRISKGYNRKSLKFTTQMGILAPTQIGGVIGHEIYIGDK
jgi:hypothetical protein